MILLYHRVAAVSPDPWGVAVKPETFAEHVRMLADCFRVMPVGGLLTAIRNGCAPARAVAVTFDDGYLDNLTVAAPVLHRHAVPATVFAATEAIEGGGRWWWDELTGMFLGSGEFPDELMLEFGGQEQRWPTRDASERRIAHDDIQRSLRWAPPQAVALLLAQLRAWRPLSPAARQQLPRPMTAEELRRLPGFGVDVGAHGHAHLALHAQDAATIEADVARSRRLITDWLGRPPVGVAYPFGDSRRATRAIARRLGFPWALGVRMMPATPSSDPYDVPRVVVHDEDPEALQRRIEILQRGRLA